jgi:hypothetical protein
MGKRFWKLPGAYALKIAGTSDLSYNICCSKNGLRQRRIQNSGEHKAGLMYLIDG